MLKTRIIPTLLYDGVGLVKGIRFDSWRRVGSAMQSIKVYNMREVDELIFLDILATRENRRPDFELIDDLADECFMPLTVGGSVKTIEDIQQLLKVGADKVSINSAAVEDPSFIKEGSSRFGSQCIVVSIDAKKLANGQYEVYTHSGTKPTGKCPVNLAKEMEKMGAGEILITSIDQDGTMEGYDYELISRVSEGISLPVIASGGAGSYKDMLEVTGSAKVNAIAAASIYHFTEQTPLEAKKYLKENGVHTRI